MHEASSGDQLLAHDLESHAPHDPLESLPHVPNAVRPGRALDIDMSRAIREHRYLGIDSPDGVTEQHRLVEEDHSFGRGVERCYGGVGLAGHRASSYSPSTSASIA